MPPQESAFRRDDVIYWEKSSPDRLGQAEVLAPIPVKVRWDDRQTLARDSKGNNVTLDATMITRRSMVVGSIVLHETLEYYLGTGSDSELDPLELYEIVTNDVTPDIKNRASAYVIGLKRYKGDLPEVVS